MKRIFGSAGLIILCFLLTTATAGAVSTCNSFFGTDVNPGGNTTSITCTFNGDTFSNFAYSIAGQTTGGPFTPVIDLVTMFVNGGDTVVNFNPNLSGNVANQGISDLHFVFEVDGGLLGASLTNNGINSQIGEKVCTTQMDLTGTCNGTLLWSANASDGMTDTCGPGAATTGVGNAFCNFTPQTTVWVWKDISIGTSSSGGQLIINPNAHNSSFNQDFLTPEPMTLSLMGVGLLGLGILGRRLRK